MKVKKKNFCKHLIIGFLSAFFITEAEIFFKGQGPTPDRLMIWLIVATPVVLKQRYCIWEKISQIIRTFLILQFMLHVENFLMTFFEN